MSKLILALSSGSSSIKFALFFESGAQSNAQLQGAISEIAPPAFRARDHAGNAFTGQLPKATKSHEVALA